MSLTVTVTQFSGGITGEAGDTTLRGTANYALWLYGIFQLQARNLNGGGSVDPIPPTGNMPAKIEFVVSGSSPIPTGGTSLTLPLSWAGLGVIFAKDNIPQTSITTESNYFTWNPISRVFTVSPAAQEGQLFSINPV